MDMDDEMKNRKRIEKMMQINQEPGLPEEQATDIKRENTEVEKIQFKIANPLPSATSSTTPTTSTPAATVNSTPVVPKKLSVFGNDDDDEKNESDPEKKRKLDEESSERSEAKIKKKINADVKSQTRSALEELTSSIKKQQIRREEELRKKQEKEPKSESVLSPSTSIDYWLIPGIVVKVLNKKVGDGAFYGKKGIVTEVIDLYVGVVKMVDSNHKLKIDQAHLETVIPAIGSEVVIINGQYRGEVGILEGINVEKYKAIVRVNDSTIEKDYEAVCKIGADR